MLRKILPVILALVGLGAGAGAGIFLRPPSQPAEPAAATGHAAEPAPAQGASGHGAAGTPEAASGHAYVKLNNQFIVPIVVNGKVASLVILTLSLEVKAGTSAEVYAAEPKLRDAFLQVLFDHANAGGFNGNFTEGTKMQVLRSALLEMAKTVMGDTVSDVLINDITRQDSSG